MADKHEESLNLTKSDLAELISTAVTAAVAAAKQPNVIEQAKLDREMKGIIEANAERMENSKGQLELIAAKKWTHETCTHKHKDGNSHCVYVMEKNGPGYILCQKNQCKIRPGEQPEKGKGDPDAIYDTRLFNQVMQELPTNELFS